VPPVIALLNYISSGKLWRIFAKVYNADSRTPVPKSAVYGDSQVILERYLFIDLANQNLEDEVYPLTMWSSVPSLRPYNIKITTFTFVLLIDIVFKVLIGQVNK
jgi:hypothetical protein